MKQHKKKKHSPRTKQKEGTNYGELTLVSFWITALNGFLGFTGFSISVGITSMFLVLWLRSSK